MNKCAAVGCGAKISPQLLMCRKHWFIVPKSIRDRVWANYVRGQEKRLDATDAYMAAYHEAVAAVARREGYQAEAQAQSSLAEQYEKKAKEK